MTMEQHVGGGLNGIILFFKLCSKYIIHDFSFPVLCIILFFYIDNKALKKKIF